MKYGTQAMENFALKTRVLRKILLQLTEVNFPPSSYLSFSKLLQNDSMKVMQLWVVGSEG